MTTQRATKGGGFLLMLAILIGVGIGLWRGQPTIGLLGGVAAGAVIAILLWLIDRRRVGE